MCAEKVTAHLANERTYLAWIRTGLGVIVLGFAVARFGLAVVPTSVVEVLPGLRYSSIIGIALVLLGGVIELFAFQRYRGNQKTIASDTYEPTSSAEAILSAVIFVLAILILARLLFY